MRDILTGQGPFRHRNVRLYAWYTTLYNARAYYPVFAILFLDLGLSRETFLALNALWAGTIFLLEGPSGALADLIGRRKLILAAAVMMIMEMACLLVAPANGGALLLGLCIINRLLSGASEASASGADQALAYDTLKEKGEEAQWDQVLASLMVFRSAAFFSAMILGAILYDPSVLARLIPALAGLDRQTTLKLPIALVFLQGLACLALSWKMRETGDGQPRAKPTVKQAFAQTLGASRWMFATPAALVVVLGGILGDSFARTFATLTSTYFRFIEIPTWLFGFLGATFALTGLFVPRLAKALARTLSPRHHLLIITGWSAFSLILLAQAWPWWGILPAIGVMAVMSWTDFLVSRELNRLADSSQRATILSVKGLLFNLGYGLASLAFAGAVTGFKEAGADEGQAFQSTLLWQPVALILLIALFALWSREKTRPPSPTHPGAQPETD
ncbi:MAG: MFS transporter [Verrucomicrobiota bacterium JB023]|nr:MFS transporter [Verrucomicrobiota bacterium JB023]